MFSCWIYLSRDFHRITRTKSEVDNIVIFERFTFLMSSNQLSWLKRTTFLCQYLPMNFFKVWIVSQIIDFENSSFSMSSKLFVRLNNRDFNNLIVFKNSSFEIVFIYASFSMECLTIFRVYDSISILISSIFSFSMKNFSSFS